MHGPSSAFKYHSPVLSFSPFTRLPTPPTGNRFSSRSVRVSAMLCSLENHPFRFLETEPPVVFHAEEPVVFNPHPSQEPVSSSSGSYNTHHVHSLKLNWKNFKTLTSCSDGTSHSAGSVVDERKFRRMISNRESARRSRMRKQKHLENLRNQLNRLRIDNRELLNRVTAAVQTEQLIRWENERLRSEAVVLRQRLWNVRQVLVVRQLQQHLNPSAWPCNNVTSINGQSQQNCSLIT
ncbi:hypothetical protein C2S52_021347 [Perilla frutescens var. hirtella]|nr:hypothetical protein C2S52_021347 [Perilla frutescens var. hirtella]